MSNFDTDPRQLILEAAEISGLLKEVAALIWFVNKHEPTGRNAGRFPQRELLEELVDAFDDHIGTAHSVVEGVYVGSQGDGPDITPATGTEDEAAFESLLREVLQADEAPLSSRSKCGRAELSTGPPRSATPRDAASRRAAHEIDGHASR